jgi:hypothetical protein
LLGAFDRTQRKGVIMSRISRNRVAMLLAIGVIAPMQSLDSGLGLAASLGNGADPGQGSIGISDSTGRIGAGR